MRTSPRALSMLTSASKQGRVLHGDPESLLHSEAGLPLEKGHRTRQPFSRVVHGLSSPVELAHLA
ncbi:hypothetical protein ACN28I_28125 [Archangium gephyra]|uniref:hypothetical protein n=1 Tax=Archangium gephyra TaxID=48 RepID=UPI003B811C50